MSITNETTRVLYDGDGTTDEFAVNFRFYNEADLVVIHTDVDGVETTPVLFGGFDPLSDTLAADEYGVVITGPNAGTVYMGTAPAVGETLTILRDQDFVQQTTLTVGPLPARVIEQSLDRLTMFVQELATKFDRVPMLRISTPTSPVSLPEPNEDSFLRWNDQGDLINSAINGFADEIEYDNSVTGLTATNVQDAIDELQVGVSTGSLPAFTNEKDFLELIDTGSGLGPGWQSAQFTGFSARFGNAFFDITGIREAINAIFNFAYLLPGANLTSTVANSLREKGTAITSMTLSSAVTRNSDPILDVTFYAGSISPGNIIGSTQTGDPDSGTRTQAWTGSFSDNFTFNVRVRDDGTSNGGTPQNRDVSLTYSFVYPYYYGADVPGIAASAVAGLTKQVINSTANANRVFSFNVGDVFYFAYPASYGALTSILDENSFETIGDWTLRTENITGLDATPVSYRIYEFDNPAGVSGSTNYTFIR